MNIFNECNEKIKTSLLPNVAQLLHYSHRVRRMFKILSILLVFIASIRLTHANKSDPNLTNPNPTKNNLTKPKKHKL